MEKEEILKKSREENKNGDEKSVSDRQYSFAIAACVGGLLCMLFNIMERIIFDRPTDDLWAIYCGIGFTTALIQFIKSKNKKMLAPLILFGLGFILFTITYFIG